MSERETKRAKQWKTCNMKMQTAIEFLDVWKEQHKNGCVMQCVRGRWDEAEAERKQCSFELEQEVAISERVSGSVSGRGSSKG